MNLTAASLRTRYHYWSYICTVLYCFQAFTFKYVFYIFSYHLHFSKWGHCWFPYLPAPFAKARWPHQAAWTPRPRHLANQSPRQSSQRRQRRVSATDLRIALPQRSAEPIVRSAAPQKKGSSLKTMCVWVKTWYPKIIRNPFWWVYKPFEIIRNPYLWILADIFWGTVGLESKSLAGKAIQKALE